MHFSRWVWTAVVSLGVVASLVGIALIPGSRQPRKPALKVTPQGGVANAGNPLPEHPPTATPLPVASDEMGYQLLMMLNDAHVQAELAMTGTQLETIRCLTEEYLLARGRLHSAHRETRDESKSASREATRQGDLLLRQYGQRALTILSDGQRQRLHEVMFQLRSIDIFLESRFLAALAITPEQVRARAEQTMRQLRLDLSGRRLQRQEYENKVHQGLVAADGEVDALLTPEQRATMADWRGPPIAFGRMHLRLVLHAQPAVARK